VRGEVWELAMSREKLEPGAEATRFVSLASAGDFLAIGKMTENMRPVLSKRRWLDHAGYLKAVGALLLCLAQIPSARGDSASCIAKVSSYVAELDQLLSKEKNWITPYSDLNERYFPFRDCETDALLEVVSRSRFIQPIDYLPSVKEYFIVFQSDDVKVGFTYLASEKKSDRGHAIWVNK
jgi:hypothetical protein